MSKSGSEMTPDRWQRTKEIVADALEKDAAERPAFVASACAEDSALERAVNSMLAHADDETRFDGAIDELQRVRSGGDDTRTGQIVGAYRITREIGRGGMGAVYLGERADAQFEKQVAIKILKRGTDTEEVLRRFQTERQILARLEHPHIAHLIDGGTTADGLPFFALQYVRGTRITEFCDKEKLDARARVALFLKVCAAVEFAHRNLIVHRDLKPGNILVTDEGEPMLLDFGIAKLLAPDAHTIELTVRDHQRLTPGYASPEQVRGEPVTTASDVYALGALLYELLAGESPHRFPTGAPSPTELFRVVVEGAPPRASVSTPDPEKRRALRGDLDNILLTALRKEPERRYSGVAAFSDDLRRYLEGRPVRARPATFGYRSAKFVRRHKLGVAAGALLLLTFLGGVAATWWQAQEARRQQAIAQRRFHDVRKLARAVIFDYHDLVTPLRGSTPVRERFIKDALEYLDTLSREAADDRGLLREMATAYTKIGQIQGNSYFANLGDTAGALSSYRKALALQEPLLLADPNDRALAGENAKTHVGLGDVLYSKGALQEALASYERATALREAILALEPEDSGNRLELAEAYSRTADLKGMEHYSNLGDPAGGLIAGRKAQALLEPLYARTPHDPDLRSRYSNVLTHVGMLAATTGNTAEALQAQRRGVAMLEELAAENPDSQGYEVELLAARHWLRFAMEDNGQLAEAIALSRKIVADLEHLVGADPKNVQFRRNLAVSQNTLGRELLLNGDTAGALENHRAALALTEEMLAADPGNLEKQADVALSYWRLGQAQAAANDSAAALRNYREALRLREPILATDPSNIRALDQVASIQADVGKALGAGQDFDGAQTALARSLAIAQKVSAQSPTNARLSAHLAQRLHEAGQLQLAAANPARACELLTASSAKWEELRNTGTLIPADAQKPGDVARDLAACGAARETAPGGD